MLHMSGQDTSDEVRLGQVDHILDGKRDGKNAQGALGPFKKGWSLNNGIIMGCSMEYYEIMVDS